jgi:hypothetical protein
MWRRTPQPIGLRVLEEHNPDLHGDVVDSGLHAWAWGSFHDVMPAEIGALVEFYKRGDPAQQQEKIQLKEHMDKKVALNLETAKKDYESWGAFRKGLFVSHKSNKLDQKLLHLNSEINSEFNGRFQRASLAVQRGRVHAGKYMSGLNPDHIYNKLTTGPHSHVDVEHTEIPEAVAAHDPHHPHIVTGVPVAQPSSLQAARAPISQQQILSTLMRRFPWPVRSRG